MDERAVARAVELSMGKYCSVARTLEHTAEISYGYALVPATATPGKAPA